MPNPPAKPRPAVQTPVLPYATLTEDNESGQKISLAHKIIALLLLLAGVGCWLLFGVPDFVNQLPWEVAGCTLLILAASPVRKWVGEVLDQIRRPNAHTAHWTAVGVATGAVLYLYWNAVYQNRPFVPTFHDEHMHLIQMQMMIHGRLWMPQHPLADFFETFHVFVKPVYAGMYFPGTALLYLPTLWLDLPYWLMPLLVAGTVVGMFYRVLTELVDGVAGILGALLLLACRPFRFASIMVLSYPVLMLWATLGIWVWLLWRRNHQLRYALLLGIIFGWAAITRPLDALCVAVPIGVGMLWEMRGKNLRHWISTLGLMVVAAAPFLSLQLIEDRGITGHWLQTPYDLYSSQNYPGVTMGFAPFDPSLRPQSNLLQKQLYYDYFCVPWLKGHTLDQLPSQLYDNQLHEGRLPLVVQVNLTDSILVLLFPLGLLGLSDIRRRVVWIMLPISVTAYCFFAFYLSHYAMLAALPMVLTVMLGMRQVERVFPKIGRASGTILPMLMAGFIVTGMPPIWRGISDQGGSVWPVMILVHDDLPQLVQSPVVVLFRFHKGDNFHEEPVYNVDAAWPDDSPIIHAQDLGWKRDLEIGEYYAQKQPNRNFYIFDRSPQFSPDMQDPKDPHKVTFLRPFGKAADFVAFVKAKLAQDAAARTSPP